MAAPETMEFQAETRQLLDPMVHLGLLEQGTAFCGS